MSLDLIRFPYNFLFLKFTFQFVKGVCGFRSSGELLNLTESKLLILAWFMLQF